MQLFLVAAVLVYEFGDFDVVTAVFGNFHEFAFFEPADGLQAFGGFFDAEGGGGDGIEREAVAQFFLEVDEHVEGGELVEVVGGVAVEDFVIEAEDVEADDEVGALQFGDEVVDLAFAVNFVIAARGAVGDADAHAHFGDVAPTTDFISGLLGFEIKIDDVLGHSGVI